MTIPPDWLALNLANWNERVPIEAGILGPVDGLLTGLDFSPPAITAARSLAANLNLTHRARFVQANV
jgi:hypothetical protein